jgi:hypothetical protein
VTISTVDGFVAAAKQRSLWYKTTTRTTVAGGWFSMFDVAGNPGAGTLAIGNTANGVVHTDVTAGYPTVNTFGGGATGYVGRVGYANSVISQLRLFDRIFSCGAYAFNANTNLASQPSFSGRVPSGPDWTGLELWAEQVTTATGNQAVNVGYTNEAGTAARSTGAIGIGAAPTVGRCWPLPLQSGDRGVQLISNVTGTVASAGTFNVNVLRPLWSGYVAAASAYAINDFLTVGLPQVFADSALYVLTMAPSGTSSGIPFVEFCVANG